MDGKIVQKSPTLPLGVVHNCTIFFFSGCWKWWLIQRSQYIKEKYHLSGWINYAWGCRGALVPRCLGFRTCFTKCDNCRIIVQIKSFNKGTMSQRLMSGQNRVAVGNNQVDNQKRYSFCVDNKERLQAIQEIFFQGFGKGVWGGRGGGGDRGEKRQHFCGGGQEGRQVSFFDLPNEKQVQVQEIAHLDVAKASAYTPPPPNGQSLFDQTMFQNLMRWRRLQCVAAPATMKWQRLPLTGRIEKFKIISASPPDLRFVATVTTVNFNKNGPKLFIITFTLFYRWRN